MESGINWFIVWTGHKYQIGPFSDSIILVN